LWFEQKPGCALRIGTVNHAISENAVSISEWVAWFSIIKTEKEITKWNMPIPVSSDELNCMHGILLVDECDSGI